MSDEKKPEEQVNLPSMGAATKDHRTDQTPSKTSSQMSRPELQKQNTTLKQELAGADERAAGQEMREQEQNDREQELERREHTLAALQDAAQQENLMQQGPDQITPQRTPTQLPPRVSTNEETLRENTQAAINSRAEKAPLEMGKKFPDITAYLQKYGKEFQLMWINDMDGDVQRWIDVGAEPVEWATARNRHFEGITDQHESKWVRVVGGETRSGVFHVYLLKISYEEYSRIKIAPQKTRQELIARSMKAGSDQSDYGEGPGLQTYAPNLPTGQRGLEQLREVAGSIPGL
jgi:hypothetical protein